MKRYLLSIRICSLSIIFLVGFLAVAMIITMQAETRYVKAGSSNPVPPYTSWETASDSIQKCINISNEWDTIRLADGIYPESIELKKGIALIGTSTENTIIGGKYANRIQPNSFWLVLVKDSAYISKVTIIGNSQIITGVQTSPVGQWYSRYTVIEHVNFDSLENAIQISEGVVTNCKAKSEYFAFVLNPTWNSTLVIENCELRLIDNFITTAQYPASLPGESYILLKRNKVILIPGSYMKITNDYLGPPNQTFDIYNNDFYLFNPQTYTTVFRKKYNFCNNTFNTRIIGPASNIPQPAFELLGPVTFVNNIFSNLKTVIKETTLLPVQFNYNVVWGGKKQFFMDTTNTFSYPMFMGKSNIAFTGNWPLEPGSILNYDSRLQKYSPAINIGDPTILDLDKSRSDPGAHGGPGGNSYEYQDTAPQVPYWGKLVYDESISSFVGNWEPCPDQDFWKYFYYIDTNSTHGTHPHFYEGETRDTVITVPVNKKKGGRWYVWVSAIDTAGFQSYWRPMQTYTITDVEDEEFRPVKHEITGIFPNPFNAEAKVEYVIGGKGSAIFRIYDINGALLQTIDKGEQDIGNYNITLKMPNFASGVYFIRLEVKDAYTGKIAQTQSKKIVMVK